jgi:hypothetical protein
LATRRGTRFGAGVGDDQAVVCESKLRALLAELTAMRAADPSSKVSEGHNAATNPTPSATPNHIRWSADMYANRRQGGL